VQRPESAARRITPLRSRCLAQRLLTELQSNKLTELQSETDQVRTLFGGRRGGSATRKDDRGVTLGCGEPGGKTGRGGVIWEQMDEIVSAWVG
jgi:hypothetical protein